MDDQAGNTKAFRIAAVIAAVVVGGLMFGLLALVGGLGGQPPERAMHSVHDVSWGAFAGLVLAVGWLLSLKNPAGKVAILQVQLAMTAVLVVVALISGEILQAFVVGVVAMVAITTFLHPARRDVLSAGTNMSLILTGLSILALILFAKYGWDQMSLQRNAPGADEHAKEMHYATMALISFGLPVGGLVVARRAAGWRQAGWLVGLGGVLVAIVSLRFDNKVGALDSMWAIALLIGSVLFIAAVEFERRSSGAAPRPAVAAG